MTNIEAIHYSLDGQEETRKLKVKRNIGSDEHLKRALKSHISFNSLRIGSPTRVMKIRKNSPQNSPKSPLVYRGGRRVNVDCRFWPKNDCRM